MQMNKFNNYLALFTKFDMWNQVFPGVEINTELVDSKHFVVVIASLFRNETTEGLEHKMVQDFRIEQEVAKKVVFLIDLTNMTAESAYDMAKRRQQCAISDETMLEWLKVNDSQFPVPLKFIEYKPTVSSQELMAQGIKGKDLGIEIKRLETEKFKQML